MKKIIYPPVILFSLLIIGYFFVAYFLPLQLPELPSSTVFLDNKGQEMGEAIYSWSIRHRTITSEEIPDFYKKSLVTLEDRTFYTNNGISLRGIVRSTLHNIEALRVVEWGTTLSSGLIRNAFWIGEKRTIGKKILEFLYAVRLNKLYSKEEILTEYINRVNFGYMNYGLKSAAKYYFDKEPVHLTPSEQIALLILPKDSLKYNPYKKPRSFRTRFEEVVSILAKEWIVTEDEWKSILSENLSWNTKHENSLPYVVDFLNKIIVNQTPWIPFGHSSPLSGGQENITPLTRGDQGGLISTTFDLALTEQINTIAQNTLRELAWKNVSDYGILVAERWDNNPELRVMIGGENYSEITAWQVNTTLALRQPGSTMKPFTYALAFEKLWFTPETTILDLPAAYKTQENYAYEPKNYSLSYKGEVTLRQALSESINIPAVKLAEQVGVSVILDFLRWLGITSLQKDADFYGLWLTLGNGEVSLFELLQAYTIFTNKGTYCPFLIIENSPTTPCTSKINSKYTDMVVSILSDRYAKLGGFSLYSTLDFPDRNVAVKTGTSRNFRDNWTIGFTDHYIIGVWTGNKSGEDMKGVTGATGAGEIFRRIVYTLESKEQQQTPKKESTKEQSFLSITNPLEGSLYKKELTKNTDKQRIQLRFETNIPYDIKQWILDGKKTSSDFIDPVLGNHTIEIILMKDGEIIKQEKNTFQVE